MFTSIFIKWVC